MTVALLPGQIESLLRHCGVGDVSATNLTRAAYSTDASLYRIPPLVVVSPRSVDELTTVVTVCREHQVPLTTRGAGTSVAGNAIGVGVVVDLSRHLHAIKAIDPDNGIAVVEPGVIQSELQKAAAPHGWRFGPDPSTANRCTIGGMIGNNACGSRAFGYGKTSDNVESLQVLLADGSLVRFGPGGRGPDTLTKSLTSLGAQHATTISREFGRFSRQVSGYALENLQGKDLMLHRLMVGSEGTLGIVTEATLRLVREPKFTRLVVLGYASMADAADDVPHVTDPSDGITACEGMDARLIEAVTAHKRGTLPELPHGQGWLFVEVAGSSVSEAENQANAVLRRASALASEVVSSQARANQLWRLREDGAGLAGRTPDGRPCYSGWEDAAVPPEKLGHYVRAFEKLLAEHRLQAMPYGHFGDGCVHVRLDFPLNETDGPERMRSFLGEAAELVASLGGSLSGEHGDGRVRGEFLSQMYSAEALQLFREVKELFDPEYLLNPGILVDPPKVTSDLRAPGVKPLSEGLGHRFVADDGDFAKAVHRCTGVGKCRSDRTEAGQTMCPSFLASGDEKDSTRGRARLLQEMINGSLVAKQWRSDEVRDVLDLCLSCKSCKSECPAGVDMAAYKSEFLYQHYRHRLRPMSHYVIGKLPMWSRALSRMPGLVNGAMKMPLISDLAKIIAGVDRRRSIPTFAKRSFRHVFADHEPKNPTGPEVLLWIDSFVQYFAPQVGMAAVTVLEDAGYRVFTTDRQECCGLTWITTGQLDAAKRLLGRSLNALAPVVNRGVPIVGIEPSCVAVFRDDAEELLPGELATLVAKNTFTLAEFLQQEPTWKPPSLEGVEIVAQPHCHQAAVVGYEADESLLRQAGAQVDRVGGCCGLAGNFGMERGHYETSVAVAEHSLLPKVREAGTDSVVLADGFSCRTQLEDLEGTKALHMAELLAQASARQP